MKFTLNSKLKIDCAQIPPRVIRLIFFVLLNYCHANRKNGYRKLSQMG